MRDHRGALLVGALFLLLSLYYNLSIPLWESDNERSHFSYVRYIVDNHLPISTPQSGTGGNSTCRGTTSRSS